MLPTESNMTISRTDPFTNTLMLKCLPGKQFLCRLGTDRGGMIRLHIRGLEVSQGRTGRVVWADQAKDVVYTKFLIIPHRPIIRTFACASAHMDHQHQLTTKVLFLKKRQFGKSNKEIKVTMFNLILAVGLLILFLVLICFPKSMSKSLRLNISIRWVIIIGILGLFWCGLEFLTHLDSNSTGLTRLVRVLHVRV